MTRRAHTARALAIVMLGLTTAACGSTSDESTGSTDDSAAAGGGGADASGEITFSSHVSGMDQVVAAFNEEQDDIEVTFEQTPSPNQGGNAKLTNGLKAGNAPDVATVEYQDLPSFVSQGGIQPLDELAADQLGDLSDGVRSMVTFADQTWAMPYDVGPMVYFYREDVFAEAGVEVPETWEEFAQAAETISTENPGTSIASSWPNESKLFAALAWQAGGSWFEASDDAWNIDLQDEATTKVADYWQELIDNEYIPVQQGFSDEWTADLQSGDLVGYIGASWGAGGLESRTAETSAGSWRVAPLPHWGEPASGTYGGSSFVITEDSDNPEAAAAFVSWLASSPEGLAARGDIGVSYPAEPGLVPAAEEAAAGKLEHFGGQNIYEVFNAQAEVIVEGWTWGPTQSTLTTLADGLGQVGSGGTIAEALATAQESTISQLENDGVSVEQR